MPSRQHAALWRMDRLKTLFLDESGEHNLDVIDPEYPVLAPGGVVMNMDNDGACLGCGLTGFALNDRAGPRYAGPSPL